MPDDPPDPCPTEAENNLPEVRPVPLQHAERMDKGCLVMLLVVFMGVFLFVPFFWLGGAIFIVPCLLCLLIALMAPVVNPLESRSTAAKWWGRVITFLVLAGAIVTVWYRLFWQGGDKPPAEERQQHGLWSPLPAQPVPRSLWS